MTKLKGILLSEGMHGMISQIEGLAKALDLEFTHHTVELNNFWKLFPPKLTPISQKTFKKIDTQKLEVLKELYDAAISEYEEDKKILFLVKRGNASRFLTLRR